MIKDFLLITLWFHLMNIATHYYPGYIHGFFERRTKAMLVPEMQVEIYFKQFPLQDQSIKIIGRCGICKPHIIRLAYVFKVWSECMLLALSLIFIARQFWQF